MKYPKLEQALMSAGRQKKQVAEMLGITPYTLSKKLTGKAPFTLGEAQAVAELLGANIEELFSENENRLTENGKPKGLSSKEIYTLTRDLMKATRDKPEDILS